MDCDISTASCWSLSVNRRGVNRGMQIRRSVMIYQPNPPLNFRPESEIRAKIFVLHAKSKIRAQKIDDSAAVAGSGNPLKYRFESEIRAKIFSKSADLFAYSPPFNSVRLILITLWLLVIGSLI